MSLPSTILSFAAALVASAGSSRAQCAIQGIASQAYGASCVPNRLSPLLSWPQFSAAGCSIDFLLGIVGSTAQAGFLAFSMSPQLSVYPELGSCPLMTHPFAVASVGLSGQLTVRLPPALPPSTFYVNALVVHSEPIFQRTWAEPALFRLQVTLQ